MSRHGESLTTAAQEIQELVDPVRAAVGADVFFSPYELHHDPTLFSEPKRFDPDRWLPERAGAIPRGAYVPFGNGARWCIGDTLALTEIVIAAATLAGRIRLRPLPSPQGCGGRPGRHRISRFE